MGKIPFDKENGWAKKKKIIWSRCNSRLIGSNGALLISFSGHKIQETEKGKKKEKWEQRSISLCRNKNSSRARQDLGKRFWNGQLLRRWKRGQIKQRGPVSPSLNGRRIHDVTLKSTCLSLDPTLRDSEQTVVSHYDTSNPQHAILQRTYDAALGADTGHTSITLLFHLCVCVYVANSSQWVNCFHLGSSSSLTASGILTHAVCQAASSHYLTPRGEF